MKSEKKLHREKQAAMALFVLSTFPVLSQVTVSDDVAYSSINSNIRTFRLFYPSGTPVTATLPIVVMIHGGGWSAGGYATASITPSACNSDQTIACWLADHGYVVFAIDYTLVLTTALG